MASNEETILEVANVLMVDSSRFVTHVHVSLTPNGYPCSSNLTAYPVPAPAMPVKRPVTASERIKGRVLYNPTDRLKIALRALQRVLWALTSRFLKIGKMAKDGVDSFDPDF